MANITGTDADDFLPGTEDADEISGQGGNDTIWGRGGNDIISGGTGHDEIFGHGGSDTIDGGDGSDTIYGDDRIPSPADGNDVLRGGPGLDTIYGGAGNDEIYGGADRDWLVGGMGADLIDGGDGDDSITGYGDFNSSPDDNAPDVLFGGAGDDYIGASLGDTVDGGAGKDTLDFTGIGSQTGINVDFRQLANGASLSLFGATISGIEYVGSITGSNFNDVIVAGISKGGSERPGIQGLGGDDVLTGSNGVDHINGGDGNDIIYGGIGFDPATSDYRDRLNGDDGDDTIYVSSDGAAASGGRGNDRLFGGTADDDLRGDAGDDIISGGAGQDGLYGGDGNDTYIDTAANLNSDIIGDMKVGDRIVITDANISNFSFSLTGNVLTYTGGKLTFNFTELQGQLVASVAAEGGVQLALRLPPLVTIDAIAQQLVSGYWGGDVHRFAAGPGGTISVNISTLTSAEQSLARAALQQWTDIIGVAFQEVLGGAQITFDHSEGSGGPIAATSATWSNGITSSAHIQISSSWVTQNGSGLGTYSFQTYIHEIGHALGLGHPGTYNFDGTYYSDALFADDSWATSVMSYFNQQENLYFYNRNFSVNFALSPMQADILAAQQLYGASTSTRPGDTIYGFNSNAGGIYDASVYPAAALTIFDTDGMDTLDYRNGGNSQIINLNPETFSSVNAGRGNLSIARGVVIENAIGGNGSDTIIGNDANNVLTGGQGFDTLTGGGGSDTFADSRSGLSGDTITDFGRDDRIVVTDATLTGFTVSLTGSGLTFPGGSMILSNIHGGIATASAAPMGGVQLTVVRHAINNDFNGTARSDFVVRDAQSGWLANWLGTSSGAFYMDGSAHFPLDWKVVGTGDYNGDGQSDLLLRNDAGWLTNWLGTPTAWFMNNGANASLFFTPAWKVVGNGDFDGDGKADILFRRDDGWLTNWLGTSGGSFANNGANTSLFFTTDWKIASTGDFNGDGYTDILLRRDDGWVTNWLGNTNGGFTNNGANTALFFTTDWKVIGTGDVNGDGKDDLILRRDDGWITDWLGTANGGFINNGASMALFLTTDWKISSIADFNGDGREDILLRNDSGWMTNWLGTATGSFINNGANFSTFIAPNWVVQDPFM